MKENVKMVIVVLLILIGLAVIVFVRSSNQRTRHQNPNGGEVSVTAELAGSQIAVDGVVEHTTRQDNETHIISKLDNGQHQFSVNHFDYYPWAKDVLVKPETKASLISFSTLQNPKRTNLQSNGDEYKKYRAQFDTLTIPSEQDKLVSKDGTVAIWAQNNAVFAEWLGDSNKTPEAFCNEGVCSSRITVVSSVYNIRSLGFLNSYSQAVLFADDQGVYAIEIDRKNIQNFQPLVRTLIAQFIIDSERKIFVESRGEIFELSF